MNYDEVKSCPCCSGVSYVKSVGDGIVKKRLVECSLCGLKTPEVEDSVVRDEDELRFIVDGKASVLRIWNKRVGN